jgi:hypothetical protein
VRLSNSYEFELGINREFKMRFNTHSEFRHFLDGACVVLTGKAASTHKRADREPRIAARIKEWWLTDRDDGNSQSSHSRNQAYLISYFALTNEFPAAGLQLPDGSYVNADKSIIDRSIRDGHLDFHEERSSFSLTKRGHLFLTERFGVAGIAKRPE